MTYTDLTDEEYDALDEEQTRAIPKFGTEGSGWLSRREARNAGMDDEAAEWLRVKAAAEHTTTEAIIGELVRKEIAATA
jgi:hypothetical protein